MSEEFGPNFITLTDEDGNEIELEYVDAIEVDGQTYMAFFPTVDDDADEEGGVGLLRQQGKADGDDWGNEGPEGVDKHEGFSFRASAQKI